MKEYNYFDQEECFKNTRLKELKESHDTNSEEYIVCYYCGFKHRPTEIINESSLNMIFENAEERIISRKKCIECGKENEVYVTINFETERS